MFCSLNCRYALATNGFKRIANALMELVKTVQVLVKNKDSTSLKIQGFYYVANTPYLFPKSLDKTHFIHCAEHERNHTNTP